MTFQDISKWLADYIAAYPDRYGQDAMWREPLMACAPADGRFRRLKEITVADHLLPEDLLPGARTVVVWFVPFTPQVQSDNTGGERPSPGWGRAYAVTNELLGRVAMALKALIEDAGGKAAVTPATHNFDRERLVSLWSHKHLGHLIGLGRYGTNCQLITPAGCSGRMGSLVTTLNLGEHHPVVTPELCLLKAGKKCAECIKACPVGALSENGLDRKACYTRLRENYEVVMGPAGLPETTSVCGKCQVGMPCSRKSPLPFEEPS